MLTPYRGVPYHIKEFREANDGGPRNAKELFNLKRSSLRMIVERCFGVLKKRFPILVMMPSFSYPYQCELVSCCVLIHNFIRRQLYPDDFDVEDDMMLCTLLWTTKDLHIMLLDSGAMTLVTGCG